MSSKIQKLEETLKEKDHLLKTQSESLEMAWNEVKTLKKIVEEEHLEHYHCIISENEHLHKENAQMREFLLQYGIRWKGEQWAEGEFRDEAAKADLKTSQPVYWFKLKQGDIENDLALEDIMEAVDLINVKMSKWSIL